MREGGKPAEPRWLPPTVVIVIQSRQIDRFGGAHGILDENVVRSAVARAQNRWSYDPSADLADLAAPYLVGLARTQGFRDGNKRTGLACALVFLRLNGSSVHVPPQELYALTMQVAKGDAEDDLVAAYFRGRMEPADP